MDHESTTGTPAGIFRRLAALLYDLLLVAALAFVATFAMLPFTRGEAILTATQGLIGHAYHALVALVVFTYFGWCWTRSGQTLGMRAWRIRLETGAGDLIRWPGAIARFALGVAIAWLAALGGWYLRRAESVAATAGAIALIAPLVANFAWGRFDGARRTWLDRAGGARVQKVS